MTDKAEAKDKAPANEKPRAKYAQLWAAYDQARALRRDCLSRELPATSEAFAALDFTAEDGLVEAHLAVLSAERKTLKRLAKYARKHGSAVLPDESSAPPSRSAAKAPRRRPAETAALSTSVASAKAVKAAKAAKPASRAKARPAGSSSATKATAVPRRPRAGAKAGGPRGSSPSKT